MIQKGEVPEGYKKTKLGIAPKEWEESRLEKKFKRVDRKNVEGNSNVLTISAQYGLISQETFFNKSVASEDKSNYYLLEKGEFAYNKSYSNGYPYGAIKQLEYYEKGIVSPLYICFSKKDENVNIRYYSYYFESGRLNKEIQAFAQEGARNHGLLNIGISDFFAVRLCSALKEEQEKIVDILDIFEKKVYLNRKLLLEKQKQQKWFLQNYLTGKKRIRKYINEWEEVSLSDVLIEMKIKNENQEFKICSVAVQKGVINQEEHLGRSYAASDTSNYSVVSFGDIVYTKSPTGDFPYGIIKQSMILENVAVSPLYGVFKPQNNNLGYIIYSFFQSKNNVYNFLHPIVQKGAKNTINISNETFLSQKLILPMDIEEQSELANFLSQMNKEIELLQQQLEQIKLEKKAMMQLLLSGAVRVNQKGGE
jgi:type I restriction enzyme S subunit